MAYCKLLIHQIPTPRGGQETPPTARAEVEVSMGGQGNDLALFHPLNLMIMNAKDGSLNSREKLAKPDGFGWFWKSMDVFLYDAKKNHALMTL